MNISITIEEYEALHDAMEHVLMDLEGCDADENTGVVIEMRRTIRCLNSISDKYKKSDLNRRVKNILKKKL